MWKMVKYGEMCHIGGESRGSDDLVVTAINRKWTNGEKHGEHGDLVTGEKNERFSS